MSNAVRVAVMVLAVFALVPGIAGAADVMVKLEPQNNSGQSGTATLSDAGGGKTKVTVNVTGQPAGSQPMHIHKGTCASLDPKPAFPLPALTGGKAEATVNVALDQLQKEKYAINGHKSAQEVSVYVFCGEVPAK